MSGSNNQPTSELHRVLGHPVRARVLELLCEGKASPSEVARKMGVPVGNVAYHVRVLRDGDWIVPAGTKSVRGALEHFYEASGKAKSKLLTLDDRGWQQLLVLVDDFFEQANKLQALADRRAASEDVPPRFAVSVATLLHSDRPTTPPKPHPANDP
jgi:DNA-binding transcriptional ArsR family regulator